MLDEDGLQHVGDILGLVNEAMTKFDEAETRRLQEKMEKGNFTLDDFMSQMKQVNKLGPMQKVMGMIPGMGDLAKQIPVLPANSPIEFQLPINTRGRLTSEEQFANIVIKTSDQGASVKLGDLQPA